MIIVGLENPLVCTEQIHMLQQGNGVLVPNSVDKVCKGRPAADSTASPQNGFLSSSSTDIAISQTVDKNSSSIANTGERQNSNEFDISEAATQESNENDSAPSAFVQQPEQPSSFVDHQGTEFHSHGVGIPSSVLLPSAGQTRLPNIRPLARSSTPTKMTIIPLPTSINQV